MNYLDIANRRFSAHNTLIIAEIGQAHDGSLGAAHAFIDAVAAAGATAIKFQTHIAAAESTPGEPWRVKFSKQDKTRYDYWQRMEFSETQWHGLKAHADECGLLFLSSPFSMAAVTMLERVGVAAWKIASGEVTNTPMLARMAQANIPFLLSTGMSTIEEIDESVRQIRERGLPVGLFQCTSMYPTPPEKIGLNLIHFFQERYDCLIGLSDHSGRIFPALGAVTLGAAMIELHVTFHRAMFGPDVPASVTIEELKQLVEGVRFLEKVRGSPVNKDEMAQDLLEMRRLFMKSVVVTENLEAGTTLKKEHLTTKKPGTGIPAAQLHQLVGKALVRSVTKDSMLTQQDVR